MERPGAWTLLDDARECLLDALVRPEPVDVPLADAHGLVLAAPVIAPRNVPPFAASAMDGFALRAADTVSAPVTLRVVGTAGAGRPSEGAVGAGEAVAIATGGALPEGADSICPIELASVDGDQVTIRTPVELGAYARLPGSDTAAGDKVFGTGTPLGAAHLGVLASLGIDTVTVHRRITVGVLATGDELVEPPVVPGPGQIYDANRQAMLAACAEAGCGTVDLGMVTDDRAGLEAVLREAAGRCDVICTSGGVSVGVADHLKEILGRLAPDTLEWMEVRIKPGKPFGFAVVADAGVPVLCVPGNPVSALVVFELLVRPALRWLQGRPATIRRVERAVADEAFPRASDGKLHVVRVVAHVDEDGIVHVKSAGGQGSHQLRALADANALALIDDGEIVTVGDPVRVVVLDPDRLGSNESGGR